MSTHSRIEFIGRVMPSLRGGLKTSDQWALTVLGLVLFHSAIAGPGRVCLQPAQTLQNCTAATIGTYYANTDRPIVDPNTGTVSGGLRKFIDTLPGLSSANANVFLNGAPGQYISVAEPDTVSYPGAESFVMGVVEHAQRMHSDLPRETLQRSYVQLYPKLSERPASMGAANPPTAPTSAYGLPIPTPRLLADVLGASAPIYWPGSIEPIYAMDSPHYLGPVIVTQKGVAVRLKMINLLPVGGATTALDQLGNLTVTARNGDMFMPVDESLGGAGESAGTIAATQLIAGAKYTIATLANTDFVSVGAPKNAVGVTFTATAPARGTGTVVPKYSQTRVAFHLHGGDSPWISDGTPHQWIAAVNDPTPYKRGASAYSPPDQPDPGDGQYGLYWPNDQSARLMWYHDHTYGLTRQNAYAGAAAGYVIIDAAELALLNGDGSLGINKALPGSLLEQVVLVVQDKTFVPSDIAVQDAKWDTTAWGKPGDLWYPHVYEPFQLWQSTVAAGADAAAASTFNPAGRWDYAMDPNGLYQPPTGLLRADPDYGVVAFPDGSYFGGPSATPESYMDTPLINGVAYPVMNVEPKAYRVRFLNGANDRYWNFSLWIADPAVVTADGRINTEVHMVAAPDGRAGGIPDPASAGPQIIQFANEAGLLPKPIIFHPKPMTYDPTGSVLMRGAGDFFLGGAERADTVIDFSQYAGKTLILYNDSSAPVPGGDPRYDYYTEDPDQSAYGGAPSTLAGYGPNTRTVMQIRVAATLLGGAPPAAPYDPSGSGGALAVELPKAYALSADEHVSRAALRYDPATETLTLANGARISPTSTPLALKVKTIEGFTDPTFGRLIAQLGAELPQSVASTVVASGATPIAYVDKPSDIINANELQYWVIKNNDGDNHPMHFHLFNVQVLGRWDSVNNVFVQPQADELGWKETVKTWPGEDVFVALQPKTPALPFGLPKSHRLMDPTLQAGATLTPSLRAGTDGTFAFSQFDVTTGAPLPAGTVQSNEMIDFDWEYVWHCHILGHEENDLMHPLVFRPLVMLPGAPGAVAVTSVGQVTWTDPTPAFAVATKGNPSNEYGFLVERAAIVNGTVQAYGALPAAPGVNVAGVNTLANATRYQDTLLSTTTDYQYRVSAVNVAGARVSYFKATLRQGPAQPTNVSVVKAPGTTAGADVALMTVAWTDNASNESGYRVTRDNVVIARLPANTTTYADTLTGLTSANAYTPRLYSVTAVNAVSSATSATVSVVPGANVLSPTHLTATLSGTTATPIVTLNWMDQSVGESGYAVSRAAASVNPSTGVVTWMAAARLPNPTAVLAPDLQTYVDSSAGADQWYQYTVAALNGAITGPAASVTQVTATTLQPPTQFSSHGLSSVASGVRLGWRATSSALATGYRLERCVITVSATCTASSGAWSPIATLLGRSTQSATDMAVASKARYAYRLYAISSAATGLQSPVTPIVATTVP